MPDIFVAKKSKKKKKPTTKASSKKETKADVVKYTRNSLSAFVYYPYFANFVHKDPEEKVILILRKHLITNIGWLIAGSVMLFAPLALRAFPILDFLPERFKFIAIMGWYLLTTAFIFESFLSWFFNVNIVTDERVFDVDFLNLIYREMTDANIDQIQDVTVRMGSPIRTIFNYGDVVIQTAAQIPQIEFEAVPQPDRVAKILRQLRVEEEQEKLEGRVR